MSETTPTSTSSRASSTSRTSSSNSTVTRDPEPLTTLWTRPTEGCSLTVGSNGPQEDSNNPVTAYAHYVFNRYSMSCYPPNYYDVYRSLSKVYTPGLCGQGHTMPYVSERSQTFTAACCTVNYTYTNNGCVSTITTPTSAYVMEDGTAVVKPFTYIREFRHAHTVMWREADVTALQAANQSYWLTPPATQSAGDPPVETDPPPPEEQPASQGLSAGAKAGIAVGVVGAVAIAVLIFFICRHRRKRSQQSTVTADMAQANSAAEGAPFHTPAHSPHSAVASSHHGAQNIAAYYAHQQQKAQMPPQPLTELDGGMAAQPNQGYYGGHVQPANYGPPVELPAQGAAGAPAGGHDVAGQQSPSYYQQGPDTGLLSQQQQPPTQQQYYSPDGNPGAYYNR